MNKKILVKSGIVLVSIFSFFYLLFLALPLLTIPVVDKLTNDLSLELKKSLGIESQIGKLRLVTTPKLTIGVKLDNVKMSHPNNNNNNNNTFLEGENFQFKMSLLPLLAKKIEADLISADNLKLNLYVKKDGHFLLEDLINNESAPATEEESSGVEQSSFELPFGLKLSNHLPDIRLKKHDISFIDIPTGKKYSLTGNDTAVTDFIFNKKIKIQSEGKFVTDGFEAFLYNLKVFNKIMPDFDINSLLSMEQNESPSVTEANQFEFNIIDIFNLIKKYSLTAKLNTDIKLAGNISDYQIFGLVDIDNLSMLVNGAKLPESSLKIDFDKDKYNLSADLYTAKAENTKLTGYIKQGKNPYVDLSCKSNSTLKSIFDIVKTFAQIAGFDDLKTLNASGDLDIDFNLKSDFKKITSNGHFNLVKGYIGYGAYDVKINDIVSDIILDDNSVNIKKLGFSTFSVPFTVTGKILQDATADIKVSTNHLSLKGLLVSLGQAALLKENPISSGTVTVNVNVSEKLIAPKIKGDVRLDNLNLKNIPSDVSLSVNPVLVILNATDKGFNGEIDAQNLKAVNPAVSVSAPTIKALLNEKSIDFRDTNVSIGKNETVVSGKISDYLTDKIGLDFDTKGKITSKLTGIINPYNFTADIKYSIPNNAEIIIPGFDKSLLKVNGEVTVKDSLLNPVLKGQFKIPVVDIPEVPVKISNMIVNVDGEILNGNAKLESFASGGIVASSISSDYKLSGSDFYLNNLTGSAFDGSFDGNIVYNLSNEKCKVKFNGKNMSALKAIEGAAGIKNALSGNLGFVADINFQGVEYEDMIKSLKGNVSFDIKNGTLGNLGSLNSIINAQNIIQNTLLKNAVSNTSKLSAVESASEFDYITGDLSLNNSYAELKSVKMSGASMAYYVTGKFNLLNGTTNAVILGRLSSDIVGKLGNVGDLAVSKLSSSIPALGSLTSSLLKSMNESPKNVNVEEIPPLRSSETQYKDFKVVFNGGIESSSSVKSFKWLNDVDTSSTDVQTSVSDTVKDLKSSVKSTVTDVKENAAQVKEQAKEQAKTLLKSLLAPPVQNDNN